MFHKLLGNLNLNAISLEKSIAFVQFKVWRPLVNLRLQLSAGVTLRRLVSNTFLLFQNGRRAIDKHDARLKQSPLLDLLRTKAVDVCVVGAGPCDESVILHVEELLG